MAANVLALTMGDADGIAPDITLKAWMQRHVQGVPAFFYIGSREVLARRAAQLGIPCPLCPCTPETAVEMFDTALPVVAVSPHPPAAGAALTIASIARAVHYCCVGKAHAMVTNPITKARVVDAGFAFAGHTEYLAALSAEHWGEPVTPVMMLAAGDMLRTVPVTIHIPLRDVSDRLSGDLIVRTGLIVAGDLRTRLGIERPRLAITGLNPHAGENGLMGDEDHRIIAPAVARLRARGIDAAGPFAADSLFQARMRDRYDVVLAMYHDQALIAVKTLDMENSVNVTLGLPFVRTSPAHGSAVELAGTGRASAASLIAALKMATRMAGATAP